MIPIVVDAMGGDDAPQVVLEGCLLALERNADISLLLTGPETVIAPLLSGRVYDTSRLTLIDAPEVITTHEAPVSAVRSKRNSSLVVACRLLKEKRAMAMVSAGSTGAVLASAIFHVGRIKGIHRPALAPLLPTAGKPVMLIDCGANVDCKPIDLVQFGMMGSIYMQHIMGYEKPRVGLVNNGVESEKGNALTKAVYPLMEKAPYHFIGNVEARDLVSGMADVLVCDGFVGNVVLKFMEGLALTLMDMMKEEFMRDMRSKLGAKILYPGLKRFKKRIDYHQHGGAPLLGIDGGIFKAHGSANTTNIVAAIEQAKAYAINDITAVIAEQIQQAQGEREDEERR